MSIGEAAAGGGAGRPGGCEGLGGGGQWCEPAGVVVDAGGFLVGEVGGTVFGVELRAEQAGAGDVALVADVCGVLGGGPSVFLGLGAHVLGDLAGDVLVRDGDLGVSDP